MSVIQYHNTSTAPKMALCARGPNIIKGDDDDDVININENRTYLFIQLRNINSCTYMKCTQGF